MEQKLHIKTSFLGFLVKNLQIRDRLYEIFECLQMILDEKLKFHS